MKNHRNKTIVYILPPLRKISLVFLVILLPFTSCKKFVEIDAPINQVNSVLVFSSDQTATSAVVGIYSQMMISTLYFLNGGITAYAGLSSDELYNPTTSATLDPITADAIPTNSNLIQNNLWRYAYNYIYQANSCIEGLNSSTAITPALKSQLLGESYFIRALCHFYLTNLFGDVPLITSTDYTVNDVLPRTQSSQVYVQVISDLKLAQTLLNGSTISVGHLRATYWAATALLAKVYLYHKDYGPAEVAASTVISSGGFILEPNLNNVFLISSKEAILQLAPVSTLYSTAEGLTFVPASASNKPGYSITSQLLSAFEPSDQRKVSWTGSNTISGQAYFYPFKYKIRTATSITEGNTVLRLGEQYLIRAEARLEQNNLPGTVSDVNAIRQRAGLPVISSSDPVFIRAAVMQERRVELFAEWGNRWFDLKRTGTVDAVMKAVKPTWVTTAQLYPVPLLEIQRNPFLSQNPGY